MSQVICGIKKGLLAKSQWHDKMLAACEAGCPFSASRPWVAKKLLGQRQHIFASDCFGRGCRFAFRGLGRVITIRQRDLAEQVQELKGLQGKNFTIIRQMRNRIEQEQAEVGGSATFLHFMPLRSVHLKML
ncbi:MAG: hypothetical protein IPI16_19370 [Comamonadaceae bacterium]|nr:hypothetical protein [Comamonadaceae bacterium]